jgi:hypothetical protein
MQPLISGTLGASVPGLKADRAATSMMTVIGVVRIRVVNGRVSHSKFKFLLAWII